MIRLPWLRKHFLQYIPLVAVLSFASLTNGLERHTVRRHLEPQHVQHVDIDWDGNFEHVPSSRVRKKHSRSEPVPPVKAVRTEVDPNGDISAGGITKGEKPNVSSETSTVLVEASGEAISIPHGSNIESPLPDFHSVPLHVVPPVPGPLALSNGKKYPHTVTPAPSEWDPRDIWNETKAREDNFPTFQKIHPTGVRHGCNVEAQNYSVVSVKKVEWMDRPYVSLEMLLVASALCYPLLFIVLLSLCSALVGASMNVEGENFVLNSPKSASYSSTGSSTNPASPAASVVSAASTMAASVVSADGADPGQWVVKPVSVSELSPASLSTYAIWAVICYFIPISMVFGIPLSMSLLAYPYPREVLLVLTVMVGYWVYKFGIFSVMFTAVGVRSVRDSEKRNYQQEYTKFCQGEDAFGNDPAQRTVAFSLSREDQAPASEHYEHPAWEEVFHWVLVPNYKEELDVIRVCLNSVASSPLAKTQIGIVLAMELREKGCQDKAELLTSEYKDQFAQIHVSFHPPDLPNDPPGKASNVNWAAQTLQKIVKSLDQDEDMIIITVSDCDSDMHSNYFSALSYHFLSSPQKHLRIWQSPILHYKNYHRQPGFIRMGTIFTSMNEFSLIADPNSMRLPYSTYSISMKLAMAVGGWDVEWIAEDWHMGLKCFLYTLGRCQVDSIILPTVNYSPEADTLKGTVEARWVQAKRHALGFSDIPFYYMTLPLVLAALERTGGGLIDYLRMQVKGLCLITRLVNTHVVLGTFTIYSGLNLGVRGLLHLLTGLEFIGWADWVMYCGKVLGVVSFVVTFLLVCTNMAVYQEVRGRLEPPPEGLTHWSWWLPCHLIANLLVFLLYSGPFFLASGIAEWIAAVRTATSHKFEYDVCAKPSATQKDAQKTSTYL